MTKRFFIFAIIAVLIFSVPASKASSDSISGKEHYSIVRIVTKVHQQFHFAGETGKTKQADYNRILITGVHQINTILADKAYVPTEDRAKNGHNPLQVAVSLGYPEIVARLLEDRRFVKIINEKDRHGLTALDRAMIRANILLPIINPAVKYNVFRTVPFMLRLKYFVGPNRPYEKVITMVELMGGERTIDLKEFLKNRIKLHIVSIEAKLQTDKTNFAKYQKMLSSVELWHQVIKATNTERDVLEKLMPLSLAYMSMK